jgi:hypothetical protein
MYSHKSAIEEDISSLCASLSSEFLDSLDFSLDHGLLNGGFFSSNRDVSHHSDVLDKSAIGPFRGLVRTDLPPVCRMKVSCLKVRL